MDTIEAVLTRAERSYLDGSVALKASDYDSLALAVSARQDALEELHRLVQDGLVPGEHDELLHRVLRAERAFIALLDESRRELARELGGLHRQRRNAEKYAG